MPPRTITAFGQTHTLSAWARLNNISKQTIWHRLKNNWPPEDAVSASPKPPGSFLSESARRRRIELSTPAPPEPNTDTL